MAEQNNQILLETKDLQKHFPIKDFFLSFFIPYYI